MSQANPIDIPQHSVPARIMQLARAADAHALNVRRAVDDCDVVLAFEKTGGGLADMVIVTREDAGDAMDDDALRSALAQQPSGCLLVILAEDGSTWIERSGLALCNCGLRERWTA